MRTRREHLIWFQRDLEPRALDAASTREPAPVPTWIVGAVAFSVVLASTLYWTWNHTQLDFSVYLMGAKHLTDPRLYDVNLAFFPYLPFTYPPFAAAAFWPLSLFSLRVSQCLGSLVNVVSLLAMIALTLNLLRPTWSLRARLASSAALLAPAVLLEPVSLTFNFGQINLILAAMVMADLTGHVTLARRTLPRGVLIGLCAGVKLVPLIFVPYLFFTRQRRAAYNAVGNFTATVLLGTILNPRASWLYWTKYVVDANRIGGTVYLSNQSLRASFDRLTHHTWGAVATTLMALAVVVGGVALATWAWRVSSSLLGILTISTTGLLASPITWAHHLVWIVPVLLWLVGGRDRPRFGWVWAALGWWLFYRAPIWEASDVKYDELREHGWTLLRANSFFLAMVTFMVGVALMLGVRSRSRAASGAATPPHVTTTSETTDPNDSTAPA